jgi:hypothetical protein
MPGAQIAFNQVGNPIPYGTPGVARDDIWQSNPVVCQSSLSGNVTQQWQFLDVPPGSAASFTGGATPTATFTPDMLGTYRIQLTTNGGGLGNVMILVVRVRYNSSGALMYDGLCLPAFGERVGEDNVLIPPVDGPQNVRGYAPFFEELLAYVRDITGGGVIVQDAGTPFGTYTTLDFVGATLTNLGSGVLEIAISGGGGVVVQEDGSPVGTFSTLDFTDMSVSNLGGGVAQVAPAFLTNEVDCSAGGTIACPVYGSGQFALQVLAGTPAAPFVAEFTTLNNYAVYVQNNTSQPATITTSTAAGSDILQPGGCGLLAVHQGAPPLYSGAYYFLSLDSANDSTTFQPSASNLGDLVVNQTKAAIINVQATNNTPFFAVELPLPGATDSPITSLAQPGMMTLDAVVCMQSITTADCAWFKLSWGWTVVTSGSPLSLGSAQVSNVSGNSVAVAGTPPAGWVAELVVNGGSGNTTAGVAIVSDPSLTVNVSVQYEWKNVQ